MGLHRSSAEAGKLDSGFKMCEHPPALAPRPKQNLPLANLRQFENVLVFNNAFDPIKRDRSGELES